MSVVFVVLAIEPSILFMLGECANSEIYPSIVPALLIVFYVNGIIWLSVRHEKRLDRQFHGAIFICIEAC